MSKVIMADLPQPIERAQRGVLTRIRITGRCERQQSATSNDAFAVKARSNRIDPTLLSAAISHSQTSSDINKMLILSGGRVKGVAALSIRVTQIETSDGQTIDVNTSAYGVQAKSTKKKDAVKVGIASGIGAAIGAIAGGGSGAAKGAGIGAGAGGGAVLATHGDPAVISSESVVTVTLQNAVTITEAL